MESINFQENIWHIKFKSLGVGVIRQFTKGIAKCFVSQTHIANLSIYVELYAKKNGKNRLVFATKSHNNDFIFLGREIDSKTYIYNFQTYL